MSRTKIERCTRCRRRWRGSDDWNAEFRKGVFVGLLCPTCQTPEENAEAVINEATLDYSKSAFVNGRLYVSARGGGDG